MKGCRFQKPPCPEPLINHMFCIRHDAENKVEAVALKMEAERESTRKAVIRTARMIFVRSYPHRFAISDGFEEDRKDLDALVDACFKAAEAFEKKAKP